MLDAVGPEGVTGGAWPEVVRDWHAGFVDVRDLPRLRIGSDRGDYTWSRDGNSGTVNWESLERSLKAAPLFVFDEIGVAKEATDFRLDLLLAVLGARCDHPVKPFIVTSNRTPREIAQVVYDGRVASRILCGTVVNLGGDDLRMPPPPHGVSA
jgi:hypothetical protein